MSLKKSIFSLLIIFLVLATGCSKNVLLDDQNSNLLNYNFKIADLNNIDETLSNQRYSYSDDNTDKKSKRFSGFFNVEVLHFCNVVKQVSLIIGAKPLG